MGCCGASRKVGNKPKVFMPTNRKEYKDNRVKHVKRCPKCSWPMHIFRRLNEKKQSTATWLCQKCKYRENI